MNYSKPVQSKPVQSRYASGSKHTGKNVILLFGSVIISGIKPHLLSPSKSVAVINKSNDYYYKQQPATFGSVLAAIREYHEYDAKSAKKIFIAVDFKATDRDDFLKSFQMLVDVTHNDLYPESHIIFQSVLPKSGFLKEIKEVNTWLEDVITNLQVPWCCFMDCNRDFLNERGDVRRSLYSAGPTATAKDKARLLNEQGIALLTHRYMTFIKDETFVGTSDCSTRPRLLSSRHPSSHTSGVEDALPMLSLAAEQSNTHVDIGLLPPVQELASFATRLTEITEQVRVMSQITTNVEECDVVEVVRLAQEYDGQKALDYGVNLMVNAGMSYFEEEFDEFHNAAVIGSLVRCHNELLEKMDSLKFTVTTQHIDQTKLSCNAMVAEFKKSVESQTINSIAKVTVGQYLRDFRKKISDANRENGQKFKNLTHKVSFRSTEEVLYHIESFENLLDELESIFDNDTNLD